MDKEGRFSVYSYYQTFGSWQTALRECGFTPRTGGIEYTEEELLNGLHQLTADLGRPPTTAEMTQEGEYGIGAYQRHFGTWNKALETAGYDPHVLIDIPKSDLIDELERVHNRLGRSPTREEFAEISSYSTQPYRTSFGSWNGALRETGLPVVKHHFIPKAELIEELQRVAGELGGSPSIAQMKKCGEYYPTLYTKRFGTWNEALRSAELEPTPPQRAISRDELTKNLERVIEQFEGVPTKKEFISHSRYSEGPYHRVFGGYNDALRQLGYEPRHPRDGDSDYRYYGPNWPQQRERRIELDQEKCRNCNLSRGDHYQICDSDLHVHHITKFVRFEEYKRANRLTNLITLCEDCHPRLEGKPKEFFIPLAPPDSLRINPSATDASDHTTDGNYTLDRFR
jgi:5-methylcytosine-specific restriction endonuclease McrA